MTVDIVCSGLEVNYIADKAPSLSLLPSLNFIVIFYDRFLVFEFVTYSHGIILFYYKISFIKYYFEAVSKNAIMIRWSLSI